ncbi:hypothetical protein [uncultured Dysgonomonas sp.]|uniref:Homeodomain phBC6A51-type domain-containing protein n=1 Tax=uncultured Dysgonomonas sp. TaxID=206096 RepID=A0A212JU70_9BACT|nr:hypothetical protein [uncultured Dysgonomonas sp.]SBW03004.1 conserved hypothetical protein [uncultured Dysgonomonas sp.]
MAKYSEELVDKVVFLIEEEFYTTTQVCKALGFSRQAYYGWLDTKPGFRKEVDMAVSRRSEAMQTMMQAALKKKLEGYITTVEKDIYVPDERNPDELVFKSKVIIKKECPPDLRTIKMLLDREDKRPSRPPLGEEVYTSRDNRVIEEETVIDNIEKDVVEDEEKEVLEVIEENEDTEAAEMIEKPDKACAGQRQGTGTAVIVSNRRPVYNKGKKRKKKRRGN